MNERSEMAAACRIQLIRPMPPKKNLNTIVKRMLASAGVDSFDLSIVFLTGPQMRALNRKALGHDYVTDVITFDLDPCIHARRGEALPRPVFLDGEIYICPAEARRNAREYGEPFERELLRYIAHGILHLLGYDDATLKQREKMRREEDRLLKYGDHLH